MTLRRLAATLFCTAMTAVALHAQNPPRDTTSWPPPTPRPDAETQRLRHEQEFKQHVEQLNPVHIGGDIKQPTKIRHVSPAYPQDAMAAGIQGVVIAEVLLDNAGAVYDLHVLRSIPQLDEAAVSAVRQWQFTPVMVKETPRAALMTVTVNFTLTK